MTRDVPSKKSKEFGGVTHLIQQNQLMKGGGCSGSKSSPSESKSSSKSANKSNSTFYTTMESPPIDYDLPDSTTGMAGLGATGSGGRGSGVGGCGSDYGASGSGKRSSSRGDVSPNRQLADYDLDEDSYTHPHTADTSHRHSPEMPSDASQFRQQQVFGGLQQNKGSAYGNDYAVSSSQSSSGQKQQQQQQYQQSTQNNYNPEVGDRVVISVRNQELGGVIRWLGNTPYMGQGDKVAGLEMDMEHESFTDGTIQGKRVFTCPPRRGMLILVKFCQPMFQDFGGHECPVVTEQVAPISTSVDIKALYGKHKGIQGHYNSCYLDATLFSMFAFNSGFDSLLYRQRNDKDDIPEYNKVQEILRDKIVNPLRKNKYVRADRLMELRELLEELGSVRGLTCEEKDPEEFLVLLLQQILKAQPFLKLSSSQESYYYQLFVEKNENVSLPTVQYLLEQSFHSSNVKLKEVPAALVVLMPRFGKSFKVYPRIVPTPQLEVTDIIENSPRICSLCGMKTAATECIECFMQKSTNPHDRLCAFCSPCDKVIHKPPSDCQYHKRTQLSLPPDFEAVREQTTVQPIYMDLFAVVCIETSHYVSFVKCGSDPGAPWCFFDSMADRVGEQNGYNIPVVEECPDLEKWLSDDSYPDLKSYFDGNLKNPPPNYVKRLLTDVYLCMYRHREVAMYQ